MGAVAEPIRKEFDLSDTQLGNLGTAFILLYAVVGVPLGRWADVGPRTKILSAGVSLWSLMTAASGKAWSFGSPSVIGVIVGVIGVASQKSKCNSNNKLAPACQILADAGNGALVRNQHSSQFDF